MSRQMSSPYTWFIFSMRSSVIPPPGHGVMAGIDPIGRVHPSKMASHSFTLNPNRPPKLGKMVASHPASLGRTPSRTLCPNPRHSSWDPPPSIAPRIAGWQMIGRPKLGSSANARAVSKPVMPGIMSTAPAPAALANLARESTRCAGALRQGAYTHRRPVSAFALRTAAQHARTRSSYGAYLWFAKPWSSLMTSMPPNANRYAISASVATEEPIGFRAVISIGPLGTPKRSRRPAVPNRGPRNAFVSVGESVRSVTMTFSLMLVLPKMTFRSCGSSPPEVSSAYRTTASHRTSDALAFAGCVAARRRDSHFATTCSLIHVPGGTSARGSSTVCSRHSASTIARAPASSGAETAYVTRKCGIGPRAGRRRRRGMDDPRVGRARTREARTREARRRGAEVSLGGDRASASAQPHHLWLRYVRRAERKRV